MQASELVQLRLRNQQLVQSRFKTPKELVTWFGAMQAQDYAAAKWALGIRLPGITAAQVEQAVADRQIVRTWPMRGTLHFVAPEDIRWMLALMTPRIIQKAATRHRQLELDEAVFAKSKAVVTKALQTSTLLTRPEIMAALETAGIATANQRGYHILWQLSQDAHLCVGPLKGKQPTFALLDEWIPKSRQLSRDESLAEIAIRYFTSHGPATVADCAWWTGLTLTDVRQGVELAGRKLTQEHINGRTYWFGPTVGAAATAGPSVHVLPAFDEYLIGYKDRSAMLASIKASDIASKNGFFWPLIVVNGQVVGTWRRVIRKHEAELLPTLFAGTQQLIKSDEMVAAVERYSRFLQLPVSIAA